MVLSVDPDGFGSKPTLIGIEPLILTQAQMRGSCTAPKVAMLREEEARLCMAVLLETEAS